MPSQLHRLSVEVAVYSVVQVDIALITQPSATLNQTAVMVRKSQMPRVLVTTGNQLGLILGIILDTFPSFNACPSTF